MADNPLTTPSNTPDCCTRCRVASRADDGRSVLVGGGWVDLHVQTARPQLQTPNVEPQDQRPDLEETSKF